MPNRRIQDSLTAKRNVHKGATNVFLGSILLCFFAGHLRLQEANSEEALRKFGGPL